MNQQPSALHNAQSMIATNKVLRNTYLLLSLTLIFSAITATIALITNAPPINLILFIVLAIGLPYAISATARSMVGLLLTFVYTGFLGWSIGPILNMYIHNFSNGAQLIGMALGMTGIIFLVLSAISLNPNRDFSHWGRFLGIGMLVIIVGVILNAFLFKLPALALAFSVVIALISGAYIMFQTNAIVRGGEKNYVIATVVLFASLYNIFLTILQLLALFAGNRN